MSNCGEAWSDEGIKCPHCDYINEPDEAHHYSEDEESHYCGGCGMEFVVTCFVSYSWTSNTLDSEE